MLCSKYFLLSNINLNRDAYPKVNVNTLENFPIPSLTKEECIILEDKANSLLSLNKALIIAKVHFSKFLSSKFEKLRINNKILEWYKYTFNDLLNELQTQKFKISLPEQNEWLHYFEDERSKVSDLQLEIHKINKQTDELIYALYKLTKEEVCFIEEF